MNLLTMFLTNRYTVIRHTRGTYVKGRYISGPEETLFVWGSLQPTNARELRLTEEADRLKQWFKFYSDERILIDSMKTLADSDRLIINGEEYRAMSYEPWQHTDLDYFMTIVYREPQQASDGRG